MKTKKIIIIVLLIFCAQNVQAAARVIFPDTRSLQPVQSGIKPNISGNINFSSNQNADNINYSNVPENNNIIENTKNSITPETTASSNFLYYILTLLLSICFIIIYIIKKISSL